MKGVIVMYSLRFKNTYHFFARTLPLTHNYLINIYLYAISFDVIIFIYQAFVDGYYIELQRLNTIVW
jgi:hypothetical protein